MLPLSNKPPSNAPEINKPPGGLNEDLQHMIRESVALTACVLSVVSKSLKKVQILHLVGRFSNLSFH